MMRRRKQRRRGHRGGAGLVDMSFRHHLMLWCILLCGIVVGLYGLWQRDHTRFERLVLAGPFQYVTPEEVQAVAHPFLEGTFLNLSLGRLRATLMADLPWVASVRASRLWPPGLKIALIERRPVAFWGQDEVLTSDGRVFRPSKRAWQVLHQQYPQGMVRFSGPKDQAGALWVFYQEAVALGGAGMAIESITLNARHAWALRLHNGVQVRLGRVNIEQRWRRFAQVYGMWSKRSDVGSLFFDFRYPNGFVVGQRAQKA